jgi:hypothetical protein
LSVKALTWAFDQPDLPPGEKVVQLILADYADEFGRAFPGQATIAGKACISEKTVSRVVNRLQERGLLRREERRRADGSRSSDLYFLAVEGQTDNLSADNGGPAKQTPTHARDRNRQEEPSESLGARARVRKPLVVDRKRVPAVIQDRAEGVLAHYNARTGRGLGGYTATGKASQALLRIVMRLTEHPALETPAVCELVDRVLANPPSWAEGATPDIGDIFGPNAFERALTNGGVKRNGKGDRGVSVASLQALKGTLG